MSNKKQKHALKSRMAFMEKEILSLNGNDRAKARNEYNKLLKTRSKECGLEEPIYFKRA